MRFVLASALLLTAMVIAPSTSLAALHDLEHQSGDGAAGAAGQAGIDLLHGHDHPEDVPAHEHELTPAAARASGVPLSAHDAAGLPARAELGFGGLPAQSRLARRTRPPDSNPPPRWQLFCTLLI